MTTPPDDDDDKYEDSYQQEEKFWEAYDKIGGKPFYSPYNRMKYGIPKEISDTEGRSPEEIRQRLERVKFAIGWSGTMYGTTGSARLWWEELEKKHAANLPKVLRLAEGAFIRDASITELYLAKHYSESNSIQVIFKYIEYARSKRDVEKGSGPPPDDLI